MLRMENDELLRRLTELQQQSWMLEEKVSRLVPFMSNGGSFQFVSVFCDCFVQPCYCMIVSQAKQW